MANCSFFPCRIGTMEVIPSNSLVPRRIPTPCGGNDNNVHVNHEAIDAAKRYPYSASVLSTK